jgi:4-amino-4-deoxy-L-arabinose transferase-like glycosyltransferase
MDGWRMRMQKPAPSTKTLRKLLSEYYPLLAILVGVVLVSSSSGPWHNIDADLEFETAANVMQWGMPYWPSFGVFLNQPPLGFYVEAAFFGVFGLTFNYGVVLITAFALGSTVMVYALGRTIYSKGTGVLAAAFFALTPWQLILSRTFLIDIQCLFLSLLFLYVGIQAVRRTSLRFVAVSGVIFAAAFLTKFYAIYALIPLAVYWLASRPRNLRRAALWLVVFFLPMLVASAVWYQGISGQGLLKVFSHDDMSNYNLPGTVPSWYFVGTFLTSSVGPWFLAAAALSLAVCFFGWKRFRAFVVFDAACLLTLLVAVGVDTYWGAGLNLSSPYLNPIKYVYQALPFLCLLGASLAAKSRALLDAAKAKRALPKFALVAVTVAGVVLLAGSMYANVDFAHRMTWYPYVVFPVEQPNDVGYAFNNPVPNEKYGAMMAVNYVGLGVVLSGLAWAGKSELRWLRKNLHLKKKA